MLVNDCVGRPRPWVQIAKAAITSNYIRNALFDRTVLAVPVSISSDAIDCAPGGIAISSAGRSSEPCCRHSSSQTNCQLRKGFRHDDASLVSRVSSLNQHRDRKINPGRRHLKAKSRNRFRAMSREPPGQDILPSSEADRITLVKTELAPP